MISSGNQSRFSIINTSLPVFDASENHEIFTAENWSKVEIRMADLKALKFMVYFLATVQTKSAAYKNGRPLTSSFIIQPFKGRIIIWSINRVFHSNQYPLGSYNKLTSWASSALLRPSMSGSWLDKGDRAKKILPKVELHFFQKSIVRRVTKSARDLLTPQQDWINLSWIQISCFRYQVQRDWRKMKISTLFLVQFSYGKKKH